MSLSRSNSPRRILPELTDPWIRRLYDVSKRPELFPEQHSFPPSHDNCRQPQIYVKPEAAMTVFELLIMSGVSLETYWAIKKHWNNKFYYSVASCWLFLYNLFYLWLFSSWLCIFLNWILNFNVFFFSQGQLTIDADKHWTFFFVWTSHTVNKSTPEKQGTLHTIYRWKHGKGRDSCIWIALLLSVSEYLYKSVDTAAPASFPLHLLPFPDCSKGKIIKLASVCRAITWYRRFDFRIIYRY